MMRSAEGSLKGSGFRAGGWQSPKGLGFRGLGFSVCPVIIPAFSLIFESWLRKEADCT